MWLTDRSISKSFLCHHCVVLYTVYVFYVRTVAVRSQHVGPRCTLWNSRPRLLPRLSLPIPTPLKWALLVQAPCLFSFSSSLLLLLLLLSTRGCRDSVWAPTEWMTARRNCRRLTVYISAAVESWQTGFNSLIVQHVQFFLGPTDVQPVAICLIWCRIVQSRDVHPCDMVPSCQVSRCKVLRFQRPCVYVYLRTRERVCAWLWAKRLNLRVRIRVSPNPNVLRQSDAADAENLKRK